MAFIAYLVVAYQVLLFSTTESEAAESTTATQLAGSYEYVNVEQLLRIQHPNSFLLNLICPSKLTVTSNSDTDEDFRLEMQNSAGDDTRCYVQDNAIVGVPLRRVQVSPDIREESSSSFTLAEVYNKFPLFAGNITDHPMICPALETIRNVTSVIAHDTGYIHTILNQYGASGLALGEPFNMVEKPQVADLRKTYTVTIFLHPDPEQELTCDYLKASELEKLNLRVDQLLTPSPTPSQIAGPSNGNNPTPTPSHSPSSTPSPPTSDSGDACFPADAQVMLREGRLVKLMHLQVGQDVLDCAGSFSKVLFFSHADPKVMHEFVHIQTEEADTVLSESHFIYTNGEIIPAGQVGVGDTITTVSRHNMTSHSNHMVRKVTRKTLKGLYNPQTSSGSIVVFWTRNGVLTSTYTTAIDPKVAHALLMPLRKLEEVSGITLPSLSTLFKRGNELLPYGFKTLQNMVRVSSSQRYEIHDVTAHDL